MKRFLVLLAGLVGLVAWLGIMGKLGKDLEPHVWAIGGFFPGLITLGGICVGFTLLASRPTWVVGMACAYRRRKTAAMLFGVGLIPVVLILIGAAEKAPGLRMAISAVLFGYFLIGFSGTALSQGARLLRIELEDPGPGASGVKPLLVGWLVRCGLLSAPLLWPAVLGYVLITSLGTPIVAWLEMRREGDPA